MHIIGASGHSKVILDILYLNNQKVSGIWDDNLELLVFMGYPINGNFKAFKEVSTDQVIIAIGDNSIRKKLSEQLINNKGIAIHPTSAISRSASIGIGTVIMANASVNADAILGRYTIINTNASIDHDCIIHDFVHISPQAGLGGNVEVGEGTHIGIGASIKQGVKIGEWAIIGAGAVIIRDVPDYAVVVGNPGRIIRYNRIE